jgi:hypothetical protein
MINVLFFNDVHEYSVFRKQICKKMFLLALYGIILSLNFTLNSFLDAKFRENSLKKSAAAAE